ncbi:MAG: hypothetical protein IMZ52_00315 [Actinobacteria bacterium]|nr:hypothetical protein [Actinomycetota bacterium]
MTQGKEITRWFSEHRNKWNDGSTHDFLLDVPCPKCNTRVLYIGVDYLLSQEKPITVPPFAYCENCGHEDSQGYKYFLKHLEVFTQ